MKFDSDVPDGAAPYHYPAKRVPEWLQGTIMLALSVLIIVVLVWIAMGRSGLQVLFATMQVLGAGGGMIAIMGGLAGGDKRMVGLGGVLAACSLIAGLIGMPLVTP